MLAQYLRGSIVRNMSHETNLATLAAAIEPFRQEYAVRIFAILKRNVEGILENLAKHDNNLRLAAPFPRSNHSRNEYIRRKNLHDSTIRWSYPDKTRKAGPSVLEDGMWTHDDFRKPRSEAEINAALVQQADDITKHDFASYCHKLAGKIGQDIASAHVEGALWSNSILTVKLVEAFRNDTPEAPKQVWSTKMILNHSKLGKLFNQWPTRRHA